MFINKIYFANTLGSIIFSVKEPVFSSSQKTIHPQKPAGVLKSFWRRVCAYPLICRLLSSRAIVSNTSISSSCVGASKYWSSLLAHSRK